MGYKKLFEPASIGGMELKNRIVMAPTGTNFPGDGSVTGNTLSFYAERARGGAGLIVVEGTGIDPQYGVELPNQLNLFVDEFMQSFKKLSAAIKKHGAKTSIQLFHPGGVASSVLIGKQALSPSGVSNPIMWDIPRVMNHEDIEYVTGTYVDAARRAREAGFDSVQVHAAEGICHQFLSPYYNKREDEYGGDLKGRVKFVIEVVGRIKDGVGRDFPVICRINGEDRTCMIAPEDSQVLAVELERAGADAVEIINGSMWECFGVPIYTNEVPRGNFAFLAGAVKKRVGIPVITNIRINDPDIAEGILQDGEGDFISTSRALLADPEWPNKTAAGRPEDINKCIACCTCIDEAFKGNHVICATNARTGFEEERLLKPAEKAKKVLVVGGGPAGMEAARVAAMRGHSVILYEKDSRLGGQLLLAVKPPYKDEIWNLINYLITQVKKHGVDIMLGYEITGDLVNKEKPDAVIVASGASPCMPDMDLEGGNAVFANDVLSEIVETGPSVVIIGGGLVGAETAEFLASRNRNVSIVEARGEICTDMPVYARDDLMRRLRELRVNILTGTKAVRVEGNTVYLEKNDQKQEVEADMVILAAETKCDRKLADELKGVVPALYTVGDCREPRRILEAIHEGFLAGNKV